MTPRGSELVRREDLALELERLVGRAGEYAAASHAAATRSAYTTAWADFAGWCHAPERSIPLHPQAADALQPLIDLARRQAGPALRPQRRPGRRRPP